MANIRKPVSATEETKIRTSIFDRRDRLSFRKNPKFYMQWVNDVRDDVQVFLDTGFTFVSEDERWGRESGIDVGKSLDSRAAVNVGRAGGMENVTAYLMKIPLDEWLRLKEENRQRVNAPMRELKKIESELKQNDAFYGKSEFGG